MVQIPGYSVIGPIGRGGMATVYRARQTLLDRDVALKVMSRQLAQDPVYSQRFLQEARMLAALNHPHVVPVYDVGVTPEGLHYFSMQLLTAGDFAARMSDGLSELELVRVLIAVAHALGFAHARGYVHRDVTPANILFDAHDTPILTDFGIARAVTSTSRITASGLSIGTSHYMSPEQARGAEVDHRSDIYSLGVLCFEAVAGKPPFDAADGFAVAFSHVHDPVPRLPDEAARWQPLIDRAMAKDPADRFADCAAFIEGLREVAPAEFRALGPAVISAQTRRVLTPPPQPLRQRLQWPRWLRWRVPAALRRLPSELASAAARLPALLRREQLPPWPFLTAGAIGVGLLLLAGWLALGASEPPAPQPLAGSPTKAAPALAPPVANTTLVTLMVAAPGTDDSAAPAAVGEPPVAGPESEPVTFVAPDGEPHTVLDPVAELLRRGRDNLGKLRLSLPADDNALADFKLALAIEPGNAEATQGIADIAQAYLALIARRDPTTEFDGWLDALAGAERIAAEHPVAAPALATVRAERRRFADAESARGEAALARWDRDAARVAFERALRVLPGHQGAEQGLAHAARLGTIGYRFNDPLGERAGPDMVVVSDSLALGHTEVTVGQFRQWWEAAGKARFGAELPRCRDRDALFAISRKRSWMAPDINQTDDHPVVCVNQPMAAAYAAWVAEQTGRRYRLPTAAELVPLASAPAAACRSNLRDSAYRTRFGGRDGADCNDGHAGTAPVGSFPAVAPGLADPVGNVREWVSDCDTGCRQAIVVGRSWHSTPDAAIRDSLPADNGFNTVGLRLARELDH